MDSSSEKSALIQKRQRFGPPDVQLTPAERDSILEKATRPAISRRISGEKSKGGVASLTTLQHTRRSGKVSPAFLITALEELRRFEESEQSNQNIIDLEREIEHLRNGMINRDSIIKKLRTELDEKNRILESLPRELVVNWVATQRMLYKEQLDTNVLNTL